MGRLLTGFSAVFLSIGGFLFGYDSGIISSTIVQPNFVTYFSSPTSSEAGGIVSGFQGGAILGALSISWLADKFGRRKTVFIGSLISILGCALQAGSATIAMLIAGRLIAGIAVGLLSAVVPMYCSEISEARHRGMLSGLLQWMLSWGFLVAQWLGYGCTFVTSSFQWRFPLAFQLVPGLLLAAGIFFIEESPRWLMEKDRFDEARTVLEKLHGNGSNQEFLDLEFQEIRDVIVAEKTLAIKSWKGLVRRPSWRKRLLLGCGIQAFGQLSGVNVINYYGPRIYQSLNIDTTTSLKITGISGSLSIIYCTIGLYVLDKIGRRIPLIVSALGCGFSLLVATVLDEHYKPGEPASNPTALRAVVSMNFVFSLAFIMTGIISWVYPAEIFPVEIRARGNSISAVVNWSLNLIIAQVSPLAFQQVGYKYFYAYFVFNMCAALCYFFFFPETKGKTLEQMDMVFGDQLALDDPEGTAKKEKAAAGIHIEGA
ncbi:probable major myo-inositol transporter iolT [Phialocephala subalpina]|uniref:Probable major myo-inositol transporter iolT n=1 Tax=Phialocephala subalpina TaxID=576137 RepID=A0A1L7XKH4_9HELO|nr:probable major myo-inositol transporter iolT [Phialocephala subalpina]